MSHTPKEQQKHPDDLLPWLVNNTLADKERSDVERHLESCTQCQQELSLLQNLRNQVKETPIQSPGEFGLNRLLNEIKTEQKFEQHTPPSSSGWWRTGLAIAASLIIFVQAGLLIDAWYLSKPVVPLSGPQEQGPVLQVSFSPTATEAQIREAIHSVDGAFMDGPSQLGIYRIRLNLLSPDNKNINQAIEQLRQQKMIVSHVAQD